jgi:adenosylcobinamide-GDP ribazoletransferase
LSSDGPLEPRPTNDKRSPATPLNFGEELLMGVRFYSRLPTGNAPHQRPNLNRMALTLPLASVVIGVIPVAVLLILEWLGTPTFFAAVIAVGAMVIVTGAMSEDALADAADGLFGGPTIEKRLEIMKDSRHGTYGVAAIGLYLLLRVTAIGAVAAYNPLAAGAIWLASTVIGRSASLWVSVALPNAREGGASASVGRVSRKAFFGGMGFAVLLAFVLAAPFTSVVAVILSLAVTVGVAAAWVWTCRKLIGGQTGDLIGALQALIEVAVLTVLLVFA